MMHRNVIVAAREEEIGPYAFYSVKLPPRLTNDCKLLLVVICKERKGKKIACVLKENPRKFTQTLSDFLRKLAPPQVFLSFECILIAYTSLSITTNRQIAHQP